MLPTTDASSTSWRSIVKVKTNVGAVTGFVQIAGATAVNGSSTSLSSGSDYRVNTSGLSTPTSLVFPLLMQVDAGHCLLRGHPYSVSRMRDSGSSVLSGAEEGRRSGSFGGPIIIISPADDDDDDDDKLPSVCGTTEELAKLACRRRRSGTRVGPPMFPPPACPLPTLPAGAVRRPRAKSTSAGPSTGRLRPLLASTSPPPTSSRRIGYNRQHQCDGGSPVVARRGSMGYVRGSIMPKSGAVSSNGRPADSARGQDGTITPGTAHCRNGGLRYLVDGASAQQHRVNVGRAASDPTPVGHSTEGSRFSLRPLRARGSLPAVVKTVVCPDSPTDPFIGEQGLVF